MTEGSLLTLNAGSSSLKFALYPVTGDTPLATGHADRIGPEGRIAVRAADGTDLPVQEKAKSHAEALGTALAALGSAFPGLVIRAVGHRVVHGGPDYSAPVVVDDATLAALEALCPFAPLHQPHNLAGLRAARAAFPGVPQVACFDTAFHRGQTFAAQAYALPRAFHDRGILRYGFHGLSYQSIAEALARNDPDLLAGRVVVAHLGNGSSMCAMAGGQSVATTMGFTALDGLPMGTRCGQIDPGVVLYLLEQEGMSPAEVSDLLYTRSGLLGLSGISHDMRTLEAANTDDARAAIDVFVARCERELGAMAAAMGGIAALVFTAGIGENSATIRARICARAGWMGIALDEGRNRAGDRIISADGAATPVLVVPTDEEAVIARATRVAIG